MALFLARLKNVTSIVGSTATGPRAAQKRVFLGGAALSIGLLTSSGAWAQCTSSPAGVDQILPVGKGGAISSLVSVIDTANTAFLAGTTAFVGSPGGAKPNQQAGGVWTRGIVGTVENNNTTTSEVRFTNPPSGPGTINCQTTTKQDFAGFQVGRDIGELNLDGSGLNVHFGLTAGWFEANAKDTSPGGTFHGDFQVPFAGLYGSATQGNFFADSQVRGDFFDNRVSDTANGLFDQQFGARSISVTGNMGYRFDVAAGDHSKWFIEPSLGGVWSHTDVDPLNVAGTFFLHPPLFGFGVPGTVQINDVESLLGRASVRVGTSFVSHKVAWQPFATASVFREFAGDVTTSQTANLAALCQQVSGDAAILCAAPVFPGGVALKDIQMIGNLTTSRVGTYGQFGLGISGQVIDTGWLGYARVDYRTGENIEGVSGNMGLRYQFNPGPTEGHSLKDGPARITPAVYNWTGFYAGGFAGMTRGQEEWDFGGGNQPEPRFGGYLLGGQAGYNYQMGTWVVGIEGDIGDSNAQGGSTPGCNSFFFTCEADIDWLASLTGRLGYAWERALFYVKGGLAAGEVAATTSFNLGGTPAFLIPLPPGTPPVNTATHTRIGWTVGTGAEFALTKNLSVTGEWLYFDLGSDTFVTPASTAEVTTRGNTARVGLNYHFGH